MNKTAPPPPRSFWKNLFLSRHEPRLRAGWRLAIQTILMLVLLGGLAIPVYVLAIVLHWNVSGAVFTLVSELVELVAFTLSIYLSCRLLDRRSFASLGLHLDRRVLPDLWPGLPSPLS